jgi:hypothetical protein
MPRPPPPGRRRCPAVLQQEQGGGSEQIPATRRRAGQRPFVLWKHPCSPSPAECVLALFTGFSAGRGPPAAARIRLFSSSPLGTRSSSPKATASARQRRHPAHRRRRQSRAAERRGVVRRAVPRQPHREFLRQDPASPPQPRRQPASQHRPLPHRAHPPAGRSPHPRLRPAPDHHTGGRTKREILRCLKRYIAREVFKIISSALAPAAT